MLSDSKFPFWYSDCLFADRGTRREEKIAGWLYIICGPPCWSTLLWYYIFRGIHLKFLFLIIFDYAFGLHWFYEIKWCFYFSKSFELNLTGNLFERSFLKYCLQVFYVSLFHTRSFLDDKIKIDMRAWCIGLLSFDLHIWLQFSP